MPGGGSSGGRRHEEPAFWSMEGMPSGWAWRSQRESPQWQETTEPHRPWKRCAARGA